MKKLLLITMSTFLMLGSLSASQVVAKKAESSRLCKVFTQKAEDYKLKMRHDKYAEVTLASYEKRAKTFCAQGK